MTVIKMRKLRTDLRTSICRLDGPLVGPDEEIGATAADDRLDCETHARKHPSRHTVRRVENLNGTYNDTRQRRGNQ